LLQVRLSPVLPAGEARRAPKKLTAYHFCGRNNEGFTALW